MPIAPASPLPTPSTPLAHADTRATTYTVTFDTNGGTPATPTQQVTQGKTATRPATDPTRDGYRFDGWFTGNTPVAYDFTRPVTQNTTITAHWTKTGQWTISPDHGPKAGGTTVTLTPPPARGIRFSQTSTGSNFSMGIDSKGDLYTWGSNSFGELGRDTGSSSQDNRPGRVTPPTGVTFTQASAGENHSMALGSDGNLYTWGNNSYGQLGRDTTGTPANRPGRVTPPTGVTFTQTSAGSSHSMALGSDGNLYTWGYNGSGQLGRDIGSNWYDKRPGRVTPPTGVTFTQTSAGSSHSVAIGSDGNLYTWGDNNTGQLGRDTSSNKDGRPGRVTAPTGVTFTQASAGENHSVALGSDGNLYTWGYNGSGQLGRTTVGTPFNRPGRVTPPDGVTFTQTSAGGSHSMAFGSDGNLYTWGWNFYGQLGRDTTGTPANRPGRVAFPSRGKPTRVLFDRVQGTGPMAGADGTWTVTTPEHAAGRVPVTISWTLDGTPQADDTSNTYRYEGPAYTVTFKAAGGTPATRTQQVTEGDTATRPATDPARDGYQFDGWFTGTTPVAYDFTRPVTGNTTITAHWTGTNGQWTISPDHGPDTGDTTVTLTPPPARGIRFSQTSAGTLHSLGIDSKGDLYTWGWNGHGQLGRDTGSSDYDNRPGRVTPPTGVTSFTQTSAGYSFSVAIGSDGNLYTWGDNYYDELGRDTTGTPANRPGRVTPPNGVTFTQVSAGSGHAMAIGSDGNLYTWGDNYDGQLGRDTGSSSQDDRPGRVTPPTGVTFTQAIGGYDFSMAIGSDGNLYTWGWNSYGQLGRDTTTGTPANRPGRVTPPNGITFTQAIAGGWHSMAIGSDGNLYTWGRNENGQLGRDTGSSSQDNRPGRVTPPNGITFTQAIAGESHSMALGSDGNLYTWGDNNDGQLGRDTTGTPANRPGRVTPPTGVTFTQAIGGYDFSMALGSDGNLYTWGDNEYGKLGRDTTGTPANRPGRVVFPSRGTPTRVLFDRVESTGPTAGADDTWTVTTPAHTAGGVPVTISWTLDGTPQADDTGNTYRYVTIGSLPLTGSHGILLLAAIGLTLMAATDAARRHRHPTRTTHTSHE